MPTDANREMAASTGGPCFGFRLRDSALQPRFMEWPGPVPQPVFKTGEAWQPHAGKVRLLRHSVCSCAERLDDQVGPGAWCGAAAAFKASAHPHSRVWLQPSEARAGGGAPIGLADRAVTTPPRGEARFWRTAVEQPAGPRALRAPAEGAEPRFAEPQAHAAPTDGSVRA